ncbi:MAG: hypothetical protein FH751_01870 [Firmicutes bacterium]|nr:hypothetical protein [Bacillota bacterium]
MIVPKKYILLLTLISILLCICIIQNVNDSDRNETFLEFTTSDIDLETINIVKKQTKTTTKLTEIYKIKRNDISIGMLSLNKHVMNNFDIYYIIEYKPLINHKDNLEIILPIKLNEPNYHYLSYEGKINYNNSKWVNGKYTKAFNLPKSSLILNDEKKSCFLSYASVYYTQDKKVRKEDYKLSKPLKIIDKGIVVSLPNIDNAIIEQWGIISEHPLIDWENKEVTKILKRMDLNRVRKWGKDGLYYKTPKSYYPTSENSYWLNPACHVGNKFIEDKGQRFFEDFSKISLVTASDTQNKKGIWYSTPRSKWLYKDYSIDGPFYDTRFNTDAALFLLKGFDKFKDKRFLHKAVKYGDFLLEYAEKHKYVTKNGGYLIWDYSNKNLSPIPNHVSLNHLITEMNFLYELYLRTEKIKYLDLGNKIKKAIRDTKNDWIREDNGDLHYAHLKDGSYGLQDYKILTLNDLKYSQKLIKSIDGKKDDCFKFLIQSKERYLKNSNIKY